MGNDKNVILRRLFYAFVACIIILFISETLYNVSVSVSDIEFFANKTILRPVFENINFSGRKHPLSPRSNPDASPFDYSVVMVTSNRFPQRYLIQSFSSITKAILRANQTLSPPPKINFVVLNAGGASKASPDLDLIRKLPFVTFVEQSALNFSFSNLSAANWHAQEIKSYVSALSLCSGPPRSVRAKYCLLVQDDALVADRLFEYLRFYFEPFAADNGDWAVVKLFVSEQFAGLSTADFLRIGVFSLSFSLLVVFFGKWSFWPVAVGASSPRRKMGRGDWACLIALSVHMFLCIFATGTNKAFSGYFSLYRGEPGVAEYKAHLTAVANIYRTEILDEMVGFCVSRVEENEIIPVDMAMKVFAQRKGLKEYVFFPSLAQHIGKISSNPNNRYNGAKRFIRSESYSNVFEA